ncbi:DUF2207 domain-containing protein [Sporosarcina sp. YIM B06819]|uniref:DUF2207 domain-containing protein n=1 Tax=Sporosarcina sp. YIM B06819 TaxID=3081769 RepID=UPI00298BCA9D|nr:DUF2207 domain-containing protein [Sporosarcina sp. YIM B06819]
MSWRKIMPAMLLLVVLLLPIHALAVDFMIPEVTIDAYLQSNGDVEVTERHTYVFKGEFNGVTRELIPKEGAEIAQFSATENGKGLTVESENGLYKIFRKGRDERVIVELRYQIRNAMEKYEDGAQFYWPFFDRRNETTYGDMKIFIHPPAIADEVLYLGYDAAYDKAVLESGGVVAFLMREVWAGNNGDIRVVYEPSLFPTIAERQGMIRPEMIAEENRLAEEEASYVAKQQRTEALGSVGIPVASGLLLTLFSFVTVLARRKKREAREEIGHSGSVVPVQRMSIPATISFTNGGVHTSEATAAALLDLVRNGYVEQLTDQKFKLISRNVAHSHEKVLIDLLFNEIGSGTHFEISDLEKYTKIERNHLTYRQSMSSWKEAVAEEVKSRELIENRTKFRLGVAFLGVVFGLATFQFAMYGSFGHTVVAAVFTLTALLFAMFYQPKNQRGTQIIEEWRQLQGMFNKFNLDEWNRLSTEDKFRAYTYGIGVKNKNFDKHFSEFADSERRTARRDSTSGSNDFVFFEPMLISSSFQSANTAVSTSDSSSSSSSSGGGTGGGGGGSGAF